MSDECRRALAATFVIQFSAISTQHSSLPSRSFLSPPRGRPSRRLRGLFESHVLDSVAGILRDCDGKTRGTEPEEVAARTIITSSGQSGVNGSGSYKTVLASRQNDALNEIFLFFD